MKRIIDLTKLTNTEKGYLVGFYVGDGNIFIDKLQGIYRLRLFTWIKETAIQENLEKIIVKMSKSLRVYNEKDNTKIFEVHSKQLIDFLQKASTKDGIIKPTSKEFVIGFIEGLIDSDGYVQRKYVEITTTNRRLKKNLLELIKSFGLKANERNFISPKSGKEGWRIGFSLVGCPFNPIKYQVSNPQTAG